MSQNIENKISNAVLKNSFIKFLKVLIPFVPHISYECLNLIGCKSVNKWPDVSLMTTQKVKLAVQINGRTRDILEIEENLDEKKVLNTILTKSKAEKYLKGKVIKKVIFVKNRVINYILSE